MILLLILDAAAIVSLPLLRARLRRRHMRLLAKERADLREAAEFIASMRAPSLYGRI